MLEDVAEARPQRHPHLREVIGGAAVCELVGPDALDSRERAFHRSQDLRHGDLISGSRELVATLGTAARAHDAGPAELGEDVLEEILRNVLTASQLFALDRAALILERRELHCGPHRVIGFGCDPHGCILSRPRRPIGFGMPLSMAYFFDRLSGESMQLDIALAGLIVGFIIGLTGMGGGALMTPVLVIFFNIHPSAAISSDVVASVVLKPIGGGVHIRKRTVNWTLVRWLAIGSVPAAFAGAWVIDAIASKGVENDVKTILGWVLLVAAAAMVLKLVLQQRRGQQSDTRLAPSLVRPLPTIAIGLIGGFLVGLTSVGSGSLMIVMLLLLYPTLSGREMVGTDLVQAIPLVTAAALGHLLFGQFSLNLTLSVLLGAIPGVYAGAHVSARASDRFIRPPLVAVLTISALKLLNVSNAVLLGSTIAAVAFVGVAYWATRVRTPTEQPERALTRR